MDNSPQRMPKEVLSLYCIQACVTFSFAVLYSSLSLYLTKQLGLSSTASNGIVGLFLAFNYLLHLLGGVIGGHYLSNRSLFFITVVLQSLGIVFLALATVSTLYVGLSLFLIGCGLHPTCYNTILTQCFQPEDPRRNKAFFLSYAAMNVGFFAGFIISGFYDYANHYQQLFYISIAINLLSLIFIRFNWRYLADKQTPLSELKHSSRYRTRNVIGLAGTLLLLPVLILGFKFSNLSNGIVVIVSILMLFVILFLIKQQKVNADKQKIKAYLILTVTSIVFWMIYYTGPMGVTLFIKNNVDRHIYHYELATQWILNINAIMIILGAPLVAALIHKIQAKGFNFSVSMQFLWAFIILAVSFFCLAFGIQFSNSEGYSGLSWIIAHFITQSCAELLIGPVGYAMIGRIAPVKLQGVLMGTWMMVSGVSASLSHYFSNAMMKTDTINPLLTNADYQHVFIQLGNCGLAAGVFLYLCAGKIGKWIDNTREHPVSDHLASGQRA